MFAGKGFTDSIASIIASLNGVLYKGTIDASSNPNFPAADAGHMYVFSVAGKIGGASGTDVVAGDSMICNTDGTAAGDLATVGTKWNIFEKNITVQTVPQGGTGLSTITDHSVMVGSGTGAVTPLTVGTNGQVLVGSTGADPVFATITDGEGIDTTLGAGTLTIAVEDASEANKGILEIATDAEAVAVTATDKAIVPSNLDNVFAAPPAIGGTTPAAGTFTTLTYTNIVSGGTSIGVPGAAGFGVGVCPTTNLPSGMTPLSGYSTVGDSNYGNYLFSDGSIMVFVPKFYYRIAHASNPTYGVHGVNSVDIRGTDTYPNTAAANAAGYALHRAFIDGGVEQPGFFVDKYKCSKNALGTGYVASSILNALPLSSSSAHNPFSGLTGGADFYYSAIDLAHRRDGSNGNVNAASIFFCASRFIHSALAMLSMAHGQAATSPTNCAWYHATYNYPKGCNNNALADTDDATVTYTSDGYSNCGRTGSGNPFAKTTHNGQSCGVADLNGLMYEISTGLTCIATSPAIEALSAANPCNVKVTGHGKVTGDYAQVNAITQATWSGLKDKIYKLTRVDDNNFTLDGIDTSAYETSTAIAGLSRAAACVVSWTAHGLSGANNKVRFSGITQTDWTALNGTEQTITVIDVDSFSIAVNTSGYAADYDPGTDPGTITKGVYNAAIDAGTVTIGKFYAAKQATAMKNFTSDNSTATGHWGATGVAAMMDEFTPAFYTTGGGAFTKRFGSGSNQVLSEALSGANRLLTGLGLPKDANGCDGTGTNLFGKDYYYQYIVNDMCLLACANWNYTTTAGVWYAGFANVRSYSSNDVSFRAACYPD